MRRKFLTLVHEDCFCARKTTPSAIGCALSHYKIWKIIRDNKISCSLVLEDDIELDENFIQKYKSISKNFPSDYDIIFIGYSQASFPPNTKTTNSLIQIPTFVYGLFGYIITNKAANKLLTNIFPIAEQLDTAISKKMNLLQVGDGQQRDRWQVYVVHPDHRLIFSEPSDTNSTFGTDIQTRGNVTDFKKPVDKNINRTIGWVIPLVIIILFIIVVILLLLLYIII